MGRAKRQLGSRRHYGLRSGRTRRRGLRRHPEVGKKTKQGASLCTVESVKAVSDIYAPVDGVVVEVNTKLSDSPELINQSAYDGGWIALIEPSDPTQIEKLMDSAGYQGFLAEIAK